MGRGISHRKESNCPICEAPIAAMSNELTWTDVEWDRMYQKAGWIKMIGAGGRTVWICSDACAKNHQRASAIYVGGR